MEALLLLLDIAFFIGLAYRVMRVIKSDEKQGLGFFSYVEQFDSVADTSNHNKQNKFLR